MLLSVRLQTYNHQDFIEQALLGIEEQKTNFNFEVVIGDDFSTDENLRVIKKFISKSKNPKVEYKLLDRKEGDTYWVKRQKLGRLYNFINTIENCRGKYIALLDGDDYWTDPLKLQKQVEFLEANSEYSICWTKYDKVDSVGNLIDKTIPEFDPSLSDVTVDNFFENYRTWTLTTVFKATSFKNHDFSKFKHFKDNTLFFAALHDSKGRVLNFNSACYRIHDSGIWSSSTDINRYLADFYNYNEIKHKIVNTPSLDNIVKQNLNDIVRSMIGYKNYKLIGINIFNVCFFPVLTKLTISMKMRFLKWYLIKFWDIYKPNFIKKH